MGVAVDLFGNQLYPKLRNPKRRSVTPQERATPCDFCKYPLTERHHVLPVPWFGENDCTLPLCPNCHELYHVVFGAIVERNPGALAKLVMLVDYFGVDDVRFGRAEHFAKFAAKQMGINFLDEGEASHD